MRDITERRAVLSAAALLTFAAEKLPDVLDLDEALHLLAFLGKHESAVVREGVIYGLAKLLKEPALADFARPMIATFRDDPSEGVRTAAEEALDV